jgi:hypothetical protein
MNMTRRTNLQPDQILNLVDAMDVDGFCQLCAEDARFCFGNAEPLIGRGSIAAGLTAFYASIAALRHHVIDTWTRDAHTLTQTDVTYRRLDGNQVTVPAATIFHTNAAGKIDEYRVFVDLAPVYS